jgi:hypothetical protein
MKRIIASMVSVCACATLVGLGIGGGSPQAASKTTSIQTQDDYIATPAGWYHRSCIHEIAPGAVVDRRHGTVKRHDGSTYQLPTCLYPPRGVRRHTGVQAPTTNGWVESAVTAQPDSSPYSAINASWTVPAAPLTAGQVYFSFPGLESSAYIIQPVLQYGDNGHFGGSFWTMASWHCNSGSDCIYSLPLTTDAGHTMYGSVAASNCGGGTCTWTITTQDDTGASTTLTVVDTQNYNFAVGAAVEAYYLDYCSQYPANGISYSGISLFDQNGAQVSPSWSPDFYGASPSCGFDVSTTATTAFLRHNPVLDIGMSGPSDISPWTTCTWSAIVFNGQPPYSYDWRQINNAGAYLNLSDPSASSVDGYSQDEGTTTLVLTVTDAVGARGSAGKLVTVRERYPSCN